MSPLWSLVVAGLLAAGGCVEAVDVRRHPLSPYHRQRLQTEQLAAQQSLLNAASDSTPYVAATFTQLISHFPADSKYHPHVNGTFQQRYWVDTSHYKPGGPVIVLDSGETGGEGRLPFLAHGIVNLLASATNGVGVVLEMRYYGKSYVTSDLSIDNLRFLDTKQSLADAANFAHHVKFPGLDGLDLTAPKTPWIYYGGSYAGAKAAYARVAYPKVFYGAISSSGVTKAIVNYSMYYNAIIKYADQTCISAMESAIQKFDAAITSGPSGTYAAAAMKKAFGLQALSHNDDVAATLIWAISWQGRNWDPTLNDPSWDSFCTNLTSPSAPSLLDSKPLGAYASMTAAYVQEACGGSEQVEACLGTYNDAANAQDDLSLNVRLWDYQFCSEEGYYQPAPPTGNPSIVSKLYTVAYQQRICNSMFPPGQYNALPKSPKVGIPNAYGGFYIAADRLAFIDGQADPWREATPHAAAAPKRTNSLLRPFYLIPGAVHHWDENGLVGGLSNPALPAEIRKVQAYEVQFVQSWLKAFKPA